MTEHRPIDEIQKDLKIATAREAELERELNAALLDACLVKVGDIVRWTEAAGYREIVTRETLVSKVHVWVDPRYPSLEGHRRNKDGSWSKAKTHVYVSGNDYEVVGHEDLP